MQNWSVFNGWCMANRVRPLRLKLSDFCDLVYYWAVRHASEDDQAKLDEVIGAPPEGQEGEVPGWSREDQMSAFDAF